MSSNDMSGISFAQPTTNEERCEVASKCCAALKMTIPFVVDEIDDHVGHAYSAMPDRLYLIDRKGKVAYKGGRGPFGFKPGELEQQIAFMLAEEQPAVASGARFAMLSNQDAWSKLPAAEANQGAPLPCWARITATSLPRTTATLLELDDLHRTKSPLDPKLRAMVRWVIADANRCKLALDTALVDLKQAGATAAELEALRGDRTPLPIETRNILDLARLLTRAAYKVSDEQMAAVRKDLGDAKLVTLVQLVAFGNFQDRLLLTLDVPGEKPLPPHGIRFKRPWEGGEVAERPAKPESIGGVPDKVTDQDWQSINFKSLQEFMEGQRGREPRVSVPSWDDVKKHRPPGSPPLKIKWSLVCQGHSPILSKPWFDGMGAFAQESKQDRVFEESLFWVITRELQCFY